jgi:glycerol-3-phosphate cytidylyltransferase
VVAQENKDKFSAWEKFGFNKMFVGSDWKGTPQWDVFEKQFNPVGVEIVYLSHTDGISSTILRDKIIKGK